MVPLELNSELLYFLAAEVVVVPTRATHLEDLVVVAASVPVVAAVARVEPQAAVVLAVTAAPV
jgi:hypothetical protein